MAERNIKLVLAYDGTRYAGWQRQKNAPTIQGAVEDALATMTGRAVTLHGAGRTDAGVHALAMTANFLTASTVPPGGFQRGLNSMLPEDIRIVAAREVPADFHARYSALGKVYGYRLVLAHVLLPTDRLYAVRVRPDLDISAMRAGLEILRGEHDFSSFEAAGSRDPRAESGRGAVRRIDRAELVREGKNSRQWQILIAGNGFLRHMVRNIVGTLLELGQGKRPAADIASLLTARERSLAGPTAPAKGLMLKEVLYSDEI